MRTLNALPPLRLVKKPNVLPPSRPSNARKRKRRTVSAGKQKKRQNWRSSNKRRRTISDDKQKNRNFGHFEAEERHNTAFRINYAKKHGHELDERDADADAGSALDTIDSPIHPGIAADLGLRDESKARN